MNHSAGLASPFTVELATTKGPLLERSGPFVSVGDIPSPICHGVEQVISFSNLSVLAEELFEGECVLNGKPVGIIVKIDEDSFPIFSPTSYLSDPSPQLLIRVI